MCCGNELCQYTFQQCVVGAVWAELGETGRLSVSTSAGANQPDWGWGGGGRPSCWPATFWGIRRLGCVCALRHPLPLLLPWEAAGRRPNSSATLRAGHALCRGAALVVVGGGGGGNGECGLGLGKQRLSVAITIPPDVAPLLPSWAPPINNMPSVPFTTAAASHSSPSQLPHRASTASATSVGLAPRWAQYGLAVCSRATAVFPPT